MGEVTPNSRAVVWTKPDKFLVLLKFKLVCTDGYVVEYGLWCTLKTDISKKLVFCQLLMKIPSRINPN